MLLRDKVVIISGVGPGMGQALAKIAAAEGAKVGLGARNQAYLDEVAAEIRAAGGEAVAVSTDIGDRAQCDRLAAVTAEAFGRIDGLVNSAYLHGSFAPFEHGDIDEWKQVMDITCFGALRMSYAVLPYLKRQSGGAIANVATMAALKPFSGEDGYAIAKGALATATRQMAADLGKYRIRVNCARMGWLWGASVKGYVQSQVAAGQREEDVIAPITARIPLGVIPPEEECAKSVLFLVSDYSKMVTGAALDVNGGEWMAP